MSISESVEAFAACGGSMAESLRAISACKVSLSEPVVTISACLGSLSKHLGVHVEAVWGHFGVFGVLLGDQAVSAAAMRLSGVLRPMWNRQRSWR